MAHPLSGTEVKTIVDEANIAAHRLARRLRLARHHIEDVHQDLLVDLIARMPSYRSCRGTIGAFAGTVFSHKASRIAASARRERDLFGHQTVSLDEPVPGGDGLSFGDVLPASGGYGAFFGQPTDDAQDSERRLALATSLSVLSTEDRSFCAAVADATVDQLAARGAGSRSTLYRRLARIGLDLTAVGIGGP